MLSDNERNKFCYYVAANVDTLLRITCNSEGSSVLENMVRKSLATAELIHNNPDDETNQYMLPLYSNLAAFFGMMKGVYTDMVEVERKKKHDKDNKYGS